VTAANLRLLGLDVGERRIGVAVSEGRVAVPLTIIEHTNRTGDIARILAIAGERETNMIVVGLPVTTSGDEGAQARLTRRFGDQLASETVLRVVYHDELMSTVDAEAALPGPRRRKVHVDDRAAAIILQRYLDSQEPA
jgi:putative Holliday junction resolvase